jgi:HEAT repeat protein
MGLFDPPDVEKMKAKRDVKGLIKALGYRKDESVRQAAAGALAQIGVPAIEPLIVAFKDEHIYVRQAAAEAMRQIGTPAIEPLIAALGGSDINVHQTTVDALSKIGAPAVEPLIATLKHQKENVRLGAAEALIKIGAPVVRPLIDALGNARQMEREAGIALAQLANLKPLVAKLKADFGTTVDAIMKSDNSEAIFEAIGVYNKAADLKSECENMLPVALRILKHIDDIRAVEMLIAAIKNKDDDVSQAAVEALGRIGGTNAIKSLVTAVHDDRRKIRETATESLVRIGKPAVEPLVADLKYDKDGVVAEVLGKIGDTRAVAPLVTALKDSGSRIPSVTVAETLDKLGWQPANDEVGAVYWAAKRRWDKCLKFGTLAVQPLSAILKNHWDSRVRQAAAKSLGQIGDAQAMEPLIAALKNNYESVRQAAAEALGQTGDARAVEPLIVALKDDEESVRQAAAEALGQTGDARAVEPLIVALKDDKGSVHQTAARALGKISDAHAVELLIAALKDDKGSVRQATAGVLVKLYQSDLLDEAHKHLILAQRDSISADHHDRIDHDDNHEYGDCRHGDRTYPHIDYGIGVAFRV